VKSVVITLTVDIPETELSKSGKLVIGTVEYLGTVTAIIAYEVQTPVVNKLTIQAPGLQIVPP
jgi:predicted alpha/beta-hydrolase family hydrolase